MTALTAQEEQEDREAEAREIRQARALLADALGTAHAIVGTAKRNLDRLVDLYDVEVVESNVGDDVGAHLAAAARSLRAAQALVKGLPA